MSSATRPALVTTLSASAPFIPSPSTCASAPRKKGARGSNPRHSSPSKSWRGGWENPYLYRVPLARRDKFAGIYSRGGKRRGTPQNIIHGTRLLTRSCPLVVAKIAIRGTSSSTFAICRELGFSEAKGISREPIFRNDVEVSPGNSVWVLFDVGIEQEIL